MTDKKHSDDLITDYMKGDSRISRQYAGMEKQRPPAALDQLIQQAAAEKIKKPASKKISWTVPFAVAATVVLSVSLTVNFIPLDPEFSGNMDEVEKQSLNKARAKAEALHRKKQKQAEEKSQQRIMVEAQEKLAGKESAVMAEQKQSKKFAPAMRTFPDARPGSQPDSQAGSQQKSQPDMQFSKMADAEIAQLPEPEPAPSASTPQASIAQQRATVTGFAATGKAPEPAEVRGVNKWIAEIEKLIEEEKISEAKKEFKALKAHYPQHAKVKVLEKKMNMLNTAD